MVSISNENELDTLIIRVQVLIGLFHFTSDPSHICDPFGGGEIVFATLHSSLGSVRVVGQFL